jgi:hypothetical protein
MTIRRRRITGNDERVASDVPSKRFKVARLRTASGWRVRMTLDAVDRPVVETRDGQRVLENPFQIARWELDERTRTTKMYDGRGAEVRLPSGSDRRLLGLSRAASDGRWDLAPAPLSEANLGSAAQGLVLTARDPGVRRTRIERQFGRPVGQVRGLDRYLSERRDTTYEVLVVPDSALPAEMNVAIGGRLVSHTTFAHESHASGVLFRRRLTSEQLVPNASSGDRSVVEIELANVRLGSGEGVQ